MTGGRWPKLYRLAHLGVIVLLLPLLFSGLALYLPSWHTALIPWLRAILILHIAMAIVFFACLAAPFLMKRPRRRLRLGEWHLSVGMTIAITITGLLIIFVLPLPGGLETLAVPLHGLLSVLLLLFTIRHGYLAQRARAKLAGPLDAMPRRAFLMWGLQGAAGVAVGGLLLGKWYGLWQIIGPKVQAASSSGSHSISEAVNSAYQPGFQYYSVVDSYPKLSLTSYRLTIGGAVENPMRLTFDELKKKFKWVEEEELFQCVTGWSVPHCHWRGIPLVDIVDAVKPKKNVKYVLFKSGDGVYTESLMLDLVKMRSNIMLAADLNGKPLSVRGGFPLRLIVPGMNGYKSIKWLNEVWFSEKDDPGYWEQRGYPEAGWAGVVG